MGKAILVAGLSFGDEGKGTIVDYLTREQKAHTVVRYNGGAQAAHNVVAGKAHHTFAQFGSGTLAGAKTHLSRFMMVNPSTLWNEAVALKKLVSGDPYYNLSVEQDALVTTPIHMIANRVREQLRGNGRHGSCGLGIGETMSYALQYPDDAIRVRDLGWPRYYEKLRVLVDRKCAELGKAFGGEYLNQMMTMDSFEERCRILTSSAKIVGNDYLQETMHKDGVTIFEGAQGVLLDQDFGFHPYTTWSDTTFGNAMKLLEGFDGDFTRMGILRSYTTRHGPGPFPTYDPEMDKVPEFHNAFGEWQREFRRGPIDLPLVRYALDAIGGVDEIAMTHMDFIFNPQLQRVCTRYEGIEHSEDGPFYRDSETGLDRIRVRKFSTEAEQLAWQSKITDGLMNCKPECWGPEQNSRKRFPDTLSSFFFGVPTTLLSYGPQAAHKQRIQRKVEE